jgi:hypothetical protein
MATFTLPNGSTISMSTGFGSALTVSAITNASPGVASSTAHGLADGDIVVMATSGWANLEGRVARVDNSVTNAFDLEGIDTSSTTRYPVGASASTAKEVTGWVQITGVLDPSGNGGEQQFWEGAPLEAQRNTRIPTTQSAAGIDLRAAYNPDASWWDYVSDAAEDREPRAVMLTLSNGAKLYYYCYVGMSVVPSLTRDEPMTVGISLSLVGDPTRYAS